MAKRKTKGKTKNFVLDTNIILHDYSCLENFEDNDIYIPIVVLEELDKFKNGNEQINYNAREFLRSLDLKADDSIFKEGISLGELSGKLYIETGSKMRDKILDIFTENIPDHKILATVLEVAERDPKRSTILVTKDINLRMKARSMGLLAEDYINDKVTSKFLFEKKHKVYQNIEGEVINKLYATREGLSFDELNLNEYPTANECFILQNCTQSALARFNPFTNTIKKIEKQTVFGIQPRNAEQVFAMEVLMDPDIKLIALTGKAGTGKTLMALAAALKQADSYIQILLARPIVSLSNKEMGFLPGDAKEKVMPYMMPLFDNLAVIKHNLTYGGADYRKLEEIQNENKLEIEALAYIRGRSLSETFCIIDEAQNLTPHEIKTIITRAGEGTRMVFTGDIEQIDSPYLDAQSNGLAYIIDKMQGQELFAHVNLLKGERSKLAEIASQIL